jgi:putative NIF3 family GTP cyclohydrolase 1 type 2
MEEVEEYRLETVVEKNGLRDVIESMLSAHPYEEAAYDIFPLFNRGPTYSMGRRGRLAQPCPLEQLAEQVKDVYQCQGLRVVGDGKQSVQRVALISGSGGSLLSRFNSKIADVVITGDVKYHEAQEAQLNGVKIIDAGHEDLEKHMIPLLAEVLKRRVESRQLDIEVIDFRSAPVFRHF